VLLLLIASTIVWPKLSNSAHETAGEGPRTSPVTSAAPAEPTSSRAARPATHYRVVPGRTIAVDRHWHAQQLRRKVQREAAPPLTFRIASFNVLGASHTARRGNKASYNDGAARMGVAVDLLRGQGVDVVGFQELEPAQAYAFRNRTGSSWGIYPGMALGSRGVRNSVAWNTATWEAVETHTTTIPYFRGNRVLIPYVKLRNPDTGREAWFISIHNPTSNAQRGNNQGWRNAATNIERNLMVQLSADGTPVFLSGDFNERNEAFCKMTYGGALQSASGGSGGPPCLLPPKLGIDWIFASTDVAFSNYLRYQTPVVHRASDHPMILADATLSGK
jgi:endonuclease/exonuclease/phosphatase family metal-dependent hydrolase